MLGLSDGWFKIIIINIIIWKTLMKNIDNTQKHMDNGSKEMQPKKKFKGSAGNQRYEECLWLAYQ